tara:strand:+ start:479 stop:1042 length:564 start_codon:yes stop_codon:yes gene_type:complete
MTDIAAQVMLKTIPESMIQEYGGFSKTALFKLTHSGETFRLPFYNFEVVTFSIVYGDYLKRVIDADIEIELFYVDDKNFTTDLLKQPNINNFSIQDFIFDKFNSSYNYAFYIRVNDTNKYDISQSLITNNSFQGECTICYQTTFLKHYYKCYIKDKSTHHGMCGPCSTSWYKSSSTNNCPTCRAELR